VPGDFPGGRVVISVANFESLSCFLSRGLDRLIRRFLGGRSIPPHLEIPRDHTHKFDYATVLATAGRHLRIESVRGVSLLWGFPAGRRSWSVRRSLWPRSFSGCWTTSPDGARNGAMCSSWWEARRTFLREWKGVERVDTSRLLGGVLCAAIAVVAIVFLWGVSTQSYWALAIPVTVGFLGVLAMGFWIGWTILTIKTAPPRPNPPLRPRREAERDMGPPSLPLQVENSF